METHSISLGAEGDSSMDDISVKNLLKRAYSAHLAKVRNLENELKETRQELLRVNKSGKTECIQCKKLQKALESCKQEYEDIFQEQKKNNEQLEQKLAALEKKNISVKEVSSATFEMAKKSSKCEFKSGGKEFFCCTYTNTICKEKSDPNEVAEVKNKNVRTAESVVGLLEDTNVVAPGGSVFDKTSPICSKNMRSKGFLSSIQNSFLEDSNDHSDSVLVTESLDIFSEVPNQSHCKKKMGKKDNNLVKNKLSRNCLGKENIFREENSPSEKSSSGKRRSVNNSSEDDHIVKRNKHVNSEETTKEQSYKVAASSVMSSAVARVNDKTNCINEASDSMNKCGNLSCFDVNSDFFDVDQSFLCQSSSSLLKADKKPKSLHAPEILLDDDCDFQTSVSSVSKKEKAESGFWKTSQKSSKQSTVHKSIKKTSRYKMTLEAPNLNFKKPKLKQTKLSQSIFQPNDIPVVNVAVLDEDNNKAKESDFHSKSDSQREEENSEGMQKILNPKESMNWDMGTLSFSEMERLRNVTVDIDATFVPDFLLPNSKDQTSEFSEITGLTNGSFCQNTAFMSECEKSRSSDVNINPKGQTTFNDQTSKPSTSRTDVKQMCNSFDRVPSPEKPSYKFKEDPVRKKDKRERLKGFDCKECEKYYSALGLSDEEKRKRLKECSRHRAVYEPPGTPKHFWELEFPDTQECKARGYLGDTQKVPLKSRRRRPLKIT